MNVRITKQWQYTGVWTMIAIVVGFLGYIFFYVLQGHQFNEQEEYQEEYTEAVPGLQVSDEEKVVHVPVPDEVRGIYWTALTAANKRGTELANYISDSGLNTVVIDLKMDNGQLSFETNDESLRRYMMNKPVIRDLENLLSGLAESGIYRIARIVVMRDSTFADEHKYLAIKTPSGAFWRDYTGGAWIDPAAPELAEYALALGKEAYARGFDEIQYDYVRFPSDGVLSATRYPIYNKTRDKQEVMKDFFEQVGGTLKNEEIPVSFDVFGMTFITSNHFGIGQRLIDVYPYADYISPMVYPSHYAPYFRGHANPALAPYDVVYGSLEGGVSLLEKELAILPEASRPKIRPWLQDFDIGAVYTAPRIEAQIQASRDSGASGWLLWNARNVYEQAQYLP